MSYKPLAIGIDDFEKLRTNDYYYVDKTFLIKDLLDKKGEVNLFTRPRRFGKTLNLSMLKYYFEKSLDGKSHRQLFDGLKIMGVGEKYTKEQEKYPVIMLTLKSAKQPRWDMAYASLLDEISVEYEHCDYVLHSDNMTTANKEKFIKIRDRKANDIDYAKSLHFLCKCLYEFYHEKVIILIDEYDVPLENAYYAGFYDEMISFIRSLFESALKTNPYLKFSVITGCLRISKESIFTGLNNLNMMSILNTDYDEYFGFVEEEVMQMLTFYQRQNKMNTVREWYDGYLFGNAEVYNPWSVINFIDKLCSDENTFPTAAWSNTSSNSIVKDLIYHADDEVRGQIEQLVNWGTIEKQIHEDITYDDIHKSEDNLWNFLFFTGYLKLTNKRMIEEQIYGTFSIPNKEVRSIYKNTISNWFRDEVKVQDLSVLYSAMLEKKTDIFEQKLATQLQKSISYMDNKEGFYHGFLLGIFANLKGYLVKSNRESGFGRYDICVYSLNVSKAPVILELKLANKYKELEKSCDTALQQIEEKCYYAGLAEEGYTKVICYGMGFFKKQVKIKMIEKELEV